MDGYDRNTEGMDDQMNDTGRAAAGLAVQLGGKALGLKIGVVALVVFLAFLFILGPIILAASDQSSSAEVVACEPPGTTDNPPKAPEKVRAEQIKNAKAIDAATTKVGMSGYASRLAIITAYGESDLFNLDYGDQVNGVTNPDGSPATSFGLFQQQTSQGWGTKEQVMNPEHATMSFLLGPKHDGKGGLSAVLHWEETDYISSIIHMVQGNSDRDHYTRYIAPADSIIAEAGINASRPAKDGTAQNSAAPADTGKKDACGGSSTVNPSDANDDYPFRDITPGPGIYVVDPFGYYYGECTSFVSWRINKDAGSTTAPFKFSAAQGNFLNGSAATWKDAWLARGWTVSKTPVAGAVAWWGAGGKNNPADTSEVAVPGYGPYGHVAYVQSVTTSGKVVIEEYNNEYLSPPGHRYTLREEPLDPSQVNMFLLPPPK